MDVTISRTCTSRHCRTELLPRLFRLGKEIAGNHDLEHITTSLLSLLRDHMGAERGEFALYRSRDGSILLRRELVSREVEPLPGADGIAAQVMETGTAVIIPRIAVPPGPDAEREPSLLCVPVLHRTATLGMLRVEKRYESLEDLVRDVELMNFLASLMGQAAELFVLEREDRAIWERENRRLQDALEGIVRPPDIIGSSRAMLEVFALVAKVARSTVKVLLLGESGVGKELFAAALHHGSDRASGPFVRFNCAALPESLVESELFGHEKGSFTGAEALRKGRFEEADGGTIFLDEVGELPLSMQAKLLRVLQERSFERVGGNAPVRVDIRVVAATNRDLAAMVAEGSFREDLFYRLNMFPIVIPPLRNRGGDVVALAGHFVRRFAAENGKEIRGLSPAASQLLTAYRWPGNVRELENAIERAVILCEGPLIYGRHLPLPIQEPAEGPAPDDACGHGSRIEALERSLVTDALREHRGNMTAAASALGITRRVLGIRLQRYGIDPRTFRAGKK